MTAAELRAQITAMPWNDRWTDGEDEYVLERVVLALLPESGVFVTESALAEALTNIATADDPLESDEVLDAISLEPGSPQDIAALIIAELTRTP